MTCPIEPLPRFYHEHWDVEALCGLSGCIECTAEPGEGILWHLLYPPPDDRQDGGDASYDDIPF